MTESNIKRNPVPNITAEQRAAALEKAARVRSERAALKCRLVGGETTRVPRTCACISSYAPFPVSGTPGPTGSCASCTSTATAASPAWDAANARP